VRGNSSEIPNSSESASSWASLDFDTLGSIAGDLDDSDIPYKVDLSILANITNPNLVEHIPRVGKVFYEREKISPLFTNGLKK